MIGLVLSVASMAIFCVLAILSAILPILILLDRVVFLR